MKTENMPNLIPLNHITFAVPARRFVINSSVTVNESLPKVTEFALRLIRVCEDMEADELAKYFGFTSKETRLLLESLVDQSLIEFDGASIRLTQYAESKFYTDDDLPRFSVVKPRNDIVDFDLLTFHPVNNLQSKKSPAFSFELPVDTHQVGESIPLAERAYQTHFQLILKAKEKTNDKIDIYKISSIKSGELFGFPIDVAFSINDDIEVERHIAYDDEAPQEYILGLESAVSDALHSPASSKQEWLEDFVERFDDKLIGQFLSNRGFSFHDYVRSVHLRQEIKYSGDTQPIIGNLYMPDNANKIIASIKETLPVIGGHKESRFLTSIAWLAPDYRFWGRSKLFEEFYFRLHKELPQAKKKSAHAREDVHVLYPANRESVRHIQGMFWSKQEKSVHFYDGDLEGGRVEILLVPSCFACVLFHYAPSGNSSALVPFGFMTRNPLLIKEAQVALNEATENGKRYIGKASYGNSNHSKAALYDESFNFLSYCAV